MFRYSNDNPAASAAVVVVAVVSRNNPLAATWQWWHREYGTFFVARTHMWGESVRVDWRGLLWRGWDAAVLDD